MEKPSSSDNSIIKSAVNHTHSQSHQPNTTQTGLSRRCSWINAIRHKCSLPLALIIASSLQPLALSQPSIPQLEGCISGCVDIPFDERSAEHSIEPSHDNTPAPQDGLQTDTGEELLEGIELDGVFEQFMPHSDRFVTSPFGKNGVRLHDENGVVIATMPGLLVGISVEGDRIATTIWINNVTEQTTHLFDAMGNLIAIIPGEFQGFSPHASNLLVFDEDEQMTHLYDQHGQPLAQLNGRIRNISNQGDRIATTQPDNSSALSRYTSYLYDAQGQEIAAIPGWLYSFSEDGTRFAVNTQDSSALYDALGNPIATFSGEHFAQFYREGNFFSTVDLHTDSDDTGGAVLGYLRDATGCKRATFRGEFITSWHPDGTQFTTSSSQGSIGDWSDDISYLYTADGTEQRAVNGWLSFNETGGLIQNPELVPETATFTLPETTDRAAITLEGVYIGASEDLKHVVLYNPVTETSHLYDSEGNEVAVFPFFFSKFSPTGHLTLTNEADDRAYLYDTAGNEIGAFTGSYPVFSEDGSHLVTRMLAENTYRLFTVPAAP